MIMNVRCMIPEQSVRNILHVVTQRASFLLSFLSLASSQSFSDFVQCQVTSYDTEFVKVLLFYFRHYEYDFLLLYGEDMYDPCPGTWYLLLISTGTGIV